MTTFRNAGVPFGVVAAGVSTANIYVHGAIGFDEPITGPLGAWLFNAVPTPGQVRFEGQSVGSNNPGSGLPFNNLTMVDGFDVVFTGNGLNIGNLYECSRKNLDVQTNSTVIVVPYE